MSKITLLVVRVTCLTILACFFMSYFVISCQGEKGTISVSGMEAAFGIDKKDLKVSWADDNVALDAYPMLLAIPLTALIILSALTIPAAREKLEGITLPVKIISAAGIITAAGGIIGLIILAVANNIAIAEVQAQGQGSLICRVGIGFQLSKAAFIVMLIMPAVDIFAIPLARKIAAEKSEGGQGS